MNLICVIFNLSPFHWSFSLVRWLYHICFNIVAMLLLLLFYFILFSPIQQTTHVFVAVNSLYDKNVYAIRIVFAGYIENCVSFGGWVFVCFVIISPLALSHSYYVHQHRCCCCSVDVLKSRKKKIPRIGINQQHFTSISDIFDRAFSMSFISSVKCHTHIARFDPVTLFAAAAGAFRVVCWIYWIQIVRRLRFPFYFATYKKATELVRKIIIGTFNRERKNSVGHFQANFGLIFLQMNLQTVKTIPVKF